MVVVVAAGADNGNRPSKSKGEGPGVGMGGGVSGPALLLPDVEGEGDVRRELGADFELYAFFLRAIFSNATERCSCERGANRISIGSNVTSTGPEGDETVILTRSSNRMCARSVLSDSPTGHWLGGGFAGNASLTTPLYWWGAFEWNSDEWAVAMVPVIVLEERTRFDGGEADRFRDSVEDRLVIILASETVDDASEVLLEYGEMLPFPERISGGVGDPDASKRSSRRSRRTDMDWICCFGLVLSSKMTLRETGSSSPGPTA